MVYFYTNPSFYYMGIFFFFACSISIQMMLGYYVLKIEKEAEKIEEGKADLLLPCIREYIKEGDRIKNSSLFRRILHMASWCCLIMQNSAIR